MTREEAIKAIKAWDFLDNNEKEILETLIPELKKSENERIRKELINGFNECLKNSQYPENAQKYWHNIKIEDILAWLEKQGENKNLELKAGKWYICYRAYCCRADHLTVKEGERFMCEKDGVVKGFVIKDAEKYFKECSAPAPMELEVDDFDAELNALLKKYEHLSKKELQEPLEFYLGIVRDDLDVVREEE